jgi:raffinose/stachyose/melibiose transport system substrate-binding protein
MRRIVATMCVALLVGGAVWAGGARETDDRITITILNGHGDMEAGTSEIIAAYEAANPNVTIEAVYNSQDYATQFQSMLASGTLPDIVLVQKQNMPDLVESGIILDLSDRPVANRLFDVARAPNSYRGNLYAVPFMLQGYGLLYNEDIFNDLGIDGPPRTLSELESTIETVSAAGLSPFTTMVGETWATGQYLLFGISPYLADDPSLIADINSGAESFANDRIAGIFDFLSIMRDNQQANAISYGFGDGAAHFGGGESAMTMHGEWILRTALDVNPDLNLKIAGVPYSNDPSDPVVVVGTADGLGVNANSENLEQVLDFFDYYTTVQSAQILSSYNRALVPFEGFDGSALHPVYQDILGAIEGGQSIGWEWVNLNPASVRAADNAMQGYMNGDLSADDVLAAVEDAIDLAR